MLIIENLPESILDFIDFSNQCYVKNTEIDFTLIFEEFKKLRNLSFDDILLKETLKIKEDPNGTHIGWDINQILLYVNENFSLGISILRSSPQYLLNSVSDGAYLVIGREPFRYTYHKLNGDSNREVFDTALLPVSSEEKILLPGEFMRVHAGVDLIDWHIESPVLLFRLIGCPREFIQWTFSKEPIRPCFIASVDPATTQLSALCALFSAQKYTDSTSAMTRLLQHRNHQVRWEAAQSLWKINTKLGYQALLFLLKDAHPHVRNAATKTMKKLTHKENYDG